MIYARLIIQEGCTRFTHKFIAKTLKAFKEYLETIEEQEGTTIVDVFVDRDFNDIVVLPADYKY